jgi:hypothetical protein
VMLLLSFSVLAVVNALQARTSRKMGI